MSRRHTADRAAAVHGQWMRHGWEEAADGATAVIELMRAHRIIVERTSDALHPLGLSFARYEILMLLAFTRRGSLSIGRLGRHLQVHTTSVTSAVDRLQEDGAVERVRCERDGRVVRAVLTGEGRVLAARATEVLNASVFGNLGLNAGDLSTLLAVLRALRANAGDFDVISDRGRKAG